MHTYGKKMMVTRDEAGILGLFDGITPMTDSQIAKAYSNISNTAPKLEEVSEILRDLRRYGLIRQDDSSRELFGVPRYTINWYGMLACAHINPFAEAIEEIDGLLYALSSDIKAAAILSMDPSKEYRRENIVSEVSAFLGIEEAISSRTLANYFVRWNNELKPVKLVREHSRNGDVEWISMRKEGWAQNVYDPAIRRAMYTVLSIGNDVGRQLSLGEVFGPSSSPGKYAKGAAMYAITKTLATTGRDYTYNGLVREIGNLYRVNARHQINVMAGIGLIDYSSVYPRGSKNSGRRSRYLKMKEIEADEALGSVIKMKPYLSSNLKSVRKVIAATVAFEGWIDPYEVSKNIGVDIGTTMKVMSSLCKAGYLGRREGGGDATSVVRANRNTFALWGLLMQPIGELAWFMHNYRKELDRAPEAVEWVRQELAQENSAIGSSMAKELVGRYISIMRRG